MNELYMDRVHMIKSAVERSPLIIVAMCGDGFDGGCGMCKAGDRVVRLSIENAVVRDGEVIPHGALR